MQPLGARPLCPRPFRPPLLDAPGDQDPRTTLFPSAAAVHASENRDKCRRQRSSTACTSTASTTGPDDSATSSVRMTVHASASSGAVGGPWQPTASSCCGSRAVPRCSDELLVSSCSGLSTVIVLVVVNDVRADGLMHSRVRRRRPSLSSRSDAVADWNANEVRDGAAALMDAQWWDDVARRRQRARWNRVSQNARR